MNTRRKGLIDKLRCSCLPNHPSPELQILSQCEYFKRGHEWSVYGRITIESSLSAAFQNGSFYM